MKKLLFVIIIDCAFISAALAQAADSSKFALEAGITFNFFQQQIKTEVGGVRGEVLVNESLLGLAVQGTYELAEWLAAGIFTRYDRGTRSAGTFTGIDAGGHTITQGEVGGDYSEFWTGPLIQFRWKQLFVDAGYAALGRRRDEGRIDIPSVGGSTDGSFGTQSLTAFLFAISGTISLSHKTHLALRAEYRYRYYDSRNGEPLTDNLKHGTQSFYPYAGLKMNL